MIQNGVQMGLNVGKMNMQNHYISKNNHIFKKRHNLINKRLNILVAILCCSVNCFSALDVKLATSPFIVALYASILILLESLTVCIWTICLSACAMDAVSASCAACHLSWSNRKSCSSRTIFSRSLSS